MYGITKRTGSLKFRPGINENIKFGGAVWASPKKDGTGNPTLIFNFETEAGGTFRYVEFPIDEIRIKKDAEYQVKKHPFPRVVGGIRVEKGEDITPDQAVILAYDEVDNKINQILKAYLPEEDVMIPPVKSWEEFAKIVISKLEGKTEGQLVRLKVLLDNKLFLTIPRNGKFIENMSVTKENSKLEIKEKEKSKTVYPKPEVETVVPEGEDISDDMPF